LDADETPGRTFLVLLEGADGAAAAAAIERLAAREAVEVLVPPVTGLGFLSASGAVAAELDAWWQRMSRARARPVVLVAHEEELPRWLRGLDADFVVAVPEPGQRALYSGLAGVKVCPTLDPKRLAEVALGPREPATRAQPARPPDPFELLSSAGRLGAIARPAVPLSRGEVLGPSADAPSVRSVTKAHGPVSVGRLFDRLTQLRRPTLGDELGQAVLARKPLVAAVVSRKGGVGKTASAAAVAALLGEAVDPFGHTAALVDANIGNPDAWGRLEIRGHALTVREIVGRLTRGEEPPSPAYAETPALAVYPESRDAGDGYAPAQVQRLAAYLKARHAAVVVDLPNRLPAFTSADAALAAAWIAEAAVVVLPTTADPAALLGVAEYLAAESVRGKAVVVPYIVPRLREIRTAPEVLGFLQRIQEAGAVVVEVPDDDRATLALIRRTAITEAGLALRQAYVELASRVVEAAARETYE
jgi:MinD-like ATPase involved in chromosome partitioning or flagellar assembly